MSHISKRTLVWDLPTRVFHWSLAFLFGIMWWTGEQRMLDWHRLAGYAVITLLLFRILWGFLGSSTARFTQFLKPPRFVGHYVRHSMLHRDGNAHIGHNPLGGWSAVALILLVLVQSAFGLFAVDIDGIESGPFSYLVEFETGRFASDLHEILFNILCALVALHLVAILFYHLWRRHNLVGPMITGRRILSGDHPALTIVSVRRGMVIAIFCGGLVAALVAWLGQT